MPEGRNRGAVDDSGGLDIGFVARASLVVLGLWAIANLLWLGRELLFTAFFAVLVASFLSIFVDRLERWGVPRALAALVVVLSWVGLLVALVVLAWPKLEEQVILIRQQFPQAIEGLVAWVEDQYRVIVGEFGEPSEELRVEVRTRLGREVAGVVAGALPLLNTAVGAVAGLLVVLFTGLYLAAESKLYARGMARLVPPRSRAKVEEALTEVGHTLRRWMLGTVINMAIIFALTTLGLWLLDIPAAFALGLIAGLLEFVPIFGPILSAVPAIAIALIISPQDALWVLLLYVAVQQLESNLISPLVMKGAVKLPPALSVLVQALMAIVFGFLGLLLAVPMLAVALVLVRRLYVEGMENGASAMEALPARRAG